MEEIVTQVASKAGISADKAKSAVATVVEFIKAKLPALGGQLDALLSGGGNVADLAKKGMGGLLGK